MKNMKIILAVLLATFFAIGLLAQTDKTTTPAADVIDRTTHQIAVNQVGYETAKPKRFTAPLSPDGTAFSIRAVGASEILVGGKIQNGVGDFSAFRPADSTTRYVNPEGWVNYGASGCISLAYLKLDSAAKTTPAP
jgi:hypothetical protein